MSSAKNALCKESFYLYRKVPGQEYKVINNSSQNVKK